MKLDRKEIEPKDVPTGFYWFRNKMKVTLDIDATQYLNFVFVAQVYQNHIGTKIVVIPKNMEPLSYFNLCTLESLDRASEGSLEMMTAVKPEGW